jgi:glycosyltransferase involved in cell wall biosynthesis
VKNNVSVVIPTYNRVETLKRSVDSVMSQTYPVERIVITDNLSTDGTEEYCRELAKHDNRVVYAKADGNIVDNWKRSAFMSTTMWTKYVFDDDWLEPRCIEALIDNTTSDTIISQCGATFEPAGIECYHTFRDGWDIPASVRNGFLSVSPVTALHRTTALLQSFKMFGMLSKSCYDSGVGPNVLMNYGLVVQRPECHRHIPDILVRLDDLPGEKRSLTSHLRETNPSLLYGNHNEAYDLLDKLAKS